MASEPPAPVPKPCRGPQGPLATGCGSPNCGGPGAASFHLDRVTVVGRRQYAAANLDLAGVVADVALPIVLEALAPDRHRVAVPADAGAPVEQLDPLQHREAAVRYA